MIFEIFSEKLRGIRKSSKKTLKEVALDNNISIGFLSDIENAKRHIGFEKAIALADYFNVSLDYLCGREAIPCVLPDELEIIERYRALEPEKQRAIDALMK